LIVKKLLIIFFVSALCVGAKDFSIVSYNVENLFDLEYDENEYKEYHPNTLTWNRLALEKKVDNISRVLLELDADIVALQEIESSEALGYLLKKLPKYKYWEFSKKQQSSVGVATLSKYPIVKSKHLDVDKLDRYSRNILATTFVIDQKKFVVYNNHWRSKRAAESHRIVYAMALFNEIKKLSKDEDYIVLGDLNSNYNEYFTFKYEERLNDTKGITGINQVLNTTIEGNFVQKYNITQYEKPVHYNTWLELPSNERFSAKFRGENTTPDNILLPRALFDDKNIWYIDKSFSVFKPHYLYKNFKIVRWDLFKHKGYSDHLPIVARFSTTPQNYNFKSEKYLATLDTLYKVQQIDNFALKEMLVIYNRDKVSIVKHKDQNISDKAIMLFGASNEFVVGGVYDFKVQQLNNYNGLKEITNVSNVEKKDALHSFKEYYLDAKKIDIFDMQYQNNIVTNLSGFYKKGYLHFSKNGKYEKIRVYFKKGVKRPKDGSNITILSGHLGIYRGVIQIVIYSKHDFN